MLQYFWRRRAGCRGIVILYTYMFQTHVGFLLGFFLWTHAKTSTMCIQKHAAGEQLPQRCLTNQFYVF